jgi:hypothetical protein
MTIIDVGADDTNPQFLVIPASTKGAQGSQGIQGIQGIQGNQGDLGYSWISGSGAPSSGLGQIGWYYLDLATSDVYQKTGVATWTQVANIKGSTGATGAAGDKYSTTSSTTFSIPLVNALATFTIGLNLSYTPNQSVIVSSISNPTDHFHGSVVSYNPLNGSITILCTDTFTAGATHSSWDANLAGAVGKDGNTVLNGTAVPTGGVGVDGDFYIRTTDYTIYGAKTAGAWGSPTSLIGAQGVQGYSVYQGSGAPSGGLGVNGDTYINVLNGDVYFKSGGSWSVTGNIKGIQGNTGSAGSNGTNGIDSFTTTTANFTQPAAGANVVVAVATTLFMSVGQALFIPGGGYYTIFAIGGATSVTLTNLGYSVNAAPATIIPSVSKVSPSGLQGEYIGNLDGGKADTIYGGLSVIDGGNSLGI